MKFLKNIFLMLFICGIAVAQTVPNGGFENWSNGNPVDWGCPNNDDFKPITKTPDKHAGSSALKGEVKALSFPGMPKTMIPVAIGTGDEAEGFPVSSRILTVSGFFKFIPRGGDKLVFGAVMYKDGKEVGTGVNNITNSLSVYRQSRINIKYSNNTVVPNKCIITVSIIGPNTGQDFHEGTYFIVDDISLGQ